MIVLLQTRWLIDWLNVGVERRQGGEKSSQNLFAQSVRAQSLANSAGQIPPCCVAPPQRPIFPAAARAAGTTHDCAVRLVTPVPGHPAGNWRSGTALCRTSLREIYAT
jgi:hypothetical protein